MKYLLFTVSAVVLAACGGSSEQAAEAPAATETAAAAPTAAEKDWALKTTGQTEATESSDDQEKLVEPATGPHAWIVDSESSFVTFLGMDNGKEVFGRFSNVDAMINLDLENPEETGEIVGVVDVASSETGNSDYDETLPSKNWFYVKEYPLAKFGAKTIRKVGDSQYEADGVLTIKGVSKRITMPFTLDVKGDRATARVEMIVNRKRFNIGLGQMATEEAVPLEVPVTINIVATRAAAN